MSDVAQVAVIVPPQQRRIQGDNPTLGEIGRLLEAFRSETGDRFDRIDARFDKLDDTYVRKETYNADTRARNEYVAGLERRIGSMESNQQWIVRIVVSTVVIALMGGLFAASKFVGG